MVQCSPIPHALDTARFGRRHMPPGVVGSEVAEGETKLLGLHHTGWVMAFRFMVSCGMDGTGVQVQYICGVIVIGGVV